MSFVFLHGLSLLYRLISFTKEKTGFEFEYCFPLSDRVYCFPLSDHPNLISSQCVQVFTNFPTDLGDINYASSNRFITNIAQEYCFQYSKIPSGQWMYIRKKGGYICKRIYQHGTSIRRDLKDNLCLKLAW